MLIHSKDLFDDFMQTVVISGAFSAEERAHEGSILTDEKARKIEAGKRIDHRTPWLMRISGKGGYIPGPEFESRAKFRNISLLDHVVSVARGAAVFAELDLRRAGVDEAAIRPRVARIIAIGFLHDADKMLGRQRREGLSIEDIAGLMRRYRIDTFLAENSATTAPSDLLPMIHHVEISPSNSMRPGMRLLSAQEVGDCAYARLADRLDGIFLDSTKSAADMIEEIDRFADLRSDALKSGWRAIHVRSPHTPFLLNQLQRGISAATVDEAGMPPLIETHHDGELMALIPEAAADRIIEAAIRRTVRPFDLEMRVLTNPRGTRNILDGGESHRDLIEILATNAPEASKALFLHKGLLTEDGGIRGVLDETFLPFDFAANFAGLKKFGGSHYQPWPVSDDNSETFRKIRADAAALAVGLGCEEPKAKKLIKCVPNAEHREGELCRALEDAGHHIPAWISDINHKLSRQTLLAVLASGFCDQDVDLRDALFGDDGLLHLWLCGDGDGREGLLAKNEGSGSELARSAKAWLRGVMTRSFLVADDGATGRCHFTNIPVTLDTRIDTKSGLNGVNVSAFSGREGRPEAFYSTKQQTLVSVPAAAEHRLRSLMGEGQKGDIPAYVSTPTMMGLFASLNMKSDRDFLQINHYDLARLEIKPGKTVFPQSQTYGQHLIFGRHVSVPPKTGDRNKPAESIIGFAGMMIKAAMRMGRPVHVFCGLPVPTNAFVHFDFLPPAVERGIGGRSLRIEQLPGALEMLRVLEEMLGANNIGLEVALRYADPATRFGAACEALATINRMNDSAASRLSSLKFALQETARSHDIIMSQSDNVIIEYARAMARVQDAPGREASNAERNLGLRIALEATEACVGAINQSGNETLIAAITGSLQNEFERSSRLSWRGKRHDLQFPRKAAMEAATIFVERVLPIAFSGRPPASKARRIAMAVYQVAFETESYRPREKAPDAPATIETE